MSNGQSLTPCPQCGTTTAVHSITELADLARMQLGQMSGTPNPGVPQQQGWAAEPVAGPPPGPGGRRSFGSFGGGGFGRRGADYGGDVADSVEGAIAEVALGAAAGFVGRAIKKRVDQAMANRVMPAVNAAAASREPMLREQIAIAEKYPDICACTSDRVVFLSGGNRVVPMPNLQTLTMAEADGIVGQLRGG